MRITACTVSLSDCSTVTSIYDPNKEPEKAALQIFPNPAQEKVTIQLPEFLVIRSKYVSFSTMTIYYQWESAFLEIYDLFGKLVFRQQINQTTGEVTSEISNWQSGMYMVRIVFMNETVAEAKFLKKG